ncbi:MAG: hypothetical protein J5954_00080 [Prevotella sp.]|nr:hypothetical protein [Prevotella sp.]
MNRGFVMQAELFLQTWATDHITRAKPHITLTITIQIIQMLRSTQCYQHTIYVTDETLFQKVNTG